MDTIEERNLNRLRRGKMMLEYSKVKKSYGISLLLLLFVGPTGAHRFYLGHTLIGALILSATIITILLTSVGKASQNDFLTQAGISVWSLLVIILFIELILSYLFVGRENTRIKTRLEKEYDVKNYKVT